MSVTLLKIIKFSKLTLIMLIVFAASTTIAFTACTSLGIFNTISNLLSSGSGNIVIVYGANAKSPQTSVIPLALHNELVVIEGVEAVSPEVFSIAVLENGEPLVVRGVDPSLIRDFIDFKILDGVFITGDKFFEAIIGLEASKRFGLKVRDRVLLRSILTSNFIEVEVVGVYESKTTLDDELLVSIQVAQWLRGLPSNAISMFRVKVSEGLPLQEKLSKIIGGEGMGEEITSKAGRIISLLFSVDAKSFPSRYIVKEPSESMQEFLRRETKLNESTFWSITILVFIGSISTVTLASMLFILDHAGELSILKSIGRTRTVYSIILPVVLASSILAGLAGSIVGYIISKILSESGLLIVGTYTIQPVANILIPLISAGLTSIVSITSAKKMIDSLKT